MSLQLEAERRRKGGQARLLRTYGCRGRGYHAYDWRDRLTSQLDPNGGATIYSYDNLDNKRTLTDPDQNTTTWSYDSLGRAWKEINQAGASRNYSYDLAGKLLSKTDRDGRITAFEYDSLGRKTAEKWCDGTIVLHTFTYAYDAVGELTSASDPNATYTYTYDPLGRTVTTSGQIAALTPAVVLTGGYDDAGNLTQIAATIDRAADVVNNYQYDSAGRMTEATQAGVTGGNAVAPKQADLSYNADGQFSTIARYADLAGDDPVAASEYGYDGLGRLTTLTHAQGSTNLAGYTRQYDRANDLTHEVSVDGTANYSYDPTGQLTAATYTGGQADETYTYDPNGNRETANGSTYATGTDNQMTSDGTYTYSYDGEGNRTARWVASGAGETQPGAGDSEITTYTWDNRNRLTAVTHYASYTAYSASPPTPDQTVTYTYDVFNRWIGETTTAGGSTTQTRFVYGSNQIVLQFDMAGAGDAAASDLSHRYLWGPGVDELFSDEQLLGAPQVVWALGEELNTLGDLAVHSGGATSVVNHRVLSGKRPAEHVLDAVVA